MHLSTFIKDNMETILAEWEAFARSLGTITSAMSVDALRDHAQKMLLTIVADMDVNQSPAVQEAKGKGLGPARESTAATTHGTGRHNDGFSLLQLTSEFRALRASVLRLWLPTLDHPGKSSMDEMIRFNEAIDQAVAESVSTFADKTGEARDVFLAMLGHDLRSPLTAIGLTSEYFERPEVDFTRRVSSARRIRRSVASMSVMVNDLLEFSRLQLGGSIPIVRSNSDLVEICERAVEDARTAHPACAFQMEGPTDLPGEFDDNRLAQVFGNLLNNAAQYRSRGTPVTLAVSKEGDHAVVTVHNFGPPIPEEALEAIFRPLVQLKASGQGTEHARSSVGLGLFIARQMMEAHGGTLSVQSNDATGTYFTARLPC